MIPVVAFDEPVFVVNEGNTVTVSVIRRDDGGGAPIAVGM